MRLQRHETFTTLGSTTTGDDGTMLEEIAITKIADIVFEKYRKLKETPSTQLIQFPATDLSYTELDDATTAKQEFDKDHPDLTFENPYKKTCLIKSISITPDDTFKAKGTVEIFIDDEIIYRNKKAGNFKKLSDLQINLNRGKPINPNESIRAYLKSSDGSTVGLAVQVTFGE